MSRPSNHKAQQQRRLPGAPTTIPQPSEEQHRIIAAVKNGKSIIVDAVAGSGKTTTVLQIAQAMADKKILQVTYNKSLKDEVRADLKSHGITNLEVHSYHSLGYKYYTTECRLDTGITKSINECLAIRELSAPFDIIIVDECQDMTPLLYQFMVKFYIDNLIIYCRTKGDTEWNRGWRAQMVFMGDTYQCIYEFKKADARYLSHANILWARYMSPKYNPNDPRTIPDEAMPLNFEKLTLSVSYRLTVELAKFVNISLLHCDINKPRIIAANNRSVGLKVMLYTGAVGSSTKSIAFAASRVVFGRIMELLNKPSGALTYSDIMILMPSVKSNVGSKDSPWKVLSNLLTNQGVPVHVVGHDTERIDETITHGKVLFATFHSSKGLGRKFVVLYNFEIGYFKYFNRGEHVDRSICPNIWYVAATRCKAELHLVGGDKGTEIPFLYLPNEIYMSYITLSTSKEISNDVFIPPKHRKRIVNVRPTYTYSQYSVTNLIKHIPTETLNQITPLVNRILKPIDGNKIFDIEFNSNTESSYNGLVENVSTINSHAVMEKWYARQVKTVYGEGSRYASILIDLRCAKREITPEGVRQIVATNSPPSPETLKYGKVSVTQSIYNAIYSTPTDRVSDDILNDKLECIDLHQYKRSPTDRSPDQPVEYYLHIASIYESVTSKLDYIYKQLKGFNWMSERVIDHCLSNADECIQDVDEMSVEVSAASTQVFPGKSITRDIVERSYRIPTRPNHAIIINGRYDMIATHFDGSRSLWEFKVISNVSIVEKLQLIVYAYLSYLELAYDDSDITPTSFSTVTESILDDTLYSFCHVDEEKIIDKFYLLNLRNRDCYVLTDLIQNIDTIRTIVDTIIDDKLKNEEIMGDSAFMEQVRSSGVYIPDESIMLKKITKGALYSVTKTLMKGTSSKTKDELIQILKTTLDHDKYMNLLWSEYSRHNTNALKSDAYDGNDDNMDPMLEYDPYIADEDDGEKIYYTPDDFDYIE